MLPLIIVSLLLLYLPVRISRGFPALIRVSIWLIVIVKAILIVVMHVHVVGTTGHPIILDESVDAKTYYDVGEAFIDYRPWEITRADVSRERGASSHLGYYFINILAFQTCPDHPILFLRLMKLLVFHIGLGMLVNTWRVKTTARSAFWAYIVLGLVFYQFYYHTFRNAKDDIVLSLFMMIMAIADRTIAVAPEGRAAATYKKMFGSWIAIGVLTWIIAEIRFYLGLAIVCAFAMHIVTGRGMKTVYRALFAGAVAGGFVLLARTAGFELVEERGGVSAVSGAALNIYGLFKVFVTPLPWQHGKTILILPHTLYLFMLAPALWAFIARFRSNLEWKLYVVMAVGLVVGGHMQNFSPRKRYVMYPIFVGWIVTASRRRELLAAGREPSDADAYFAGAGNVYT